MNWLRACSMAVMAATLAGCPKTPNSIDGGTNNATDGGPTDSGVVSTEIPFANFCENVTTGFREYEFFNFTYCGTPVTREDLPHLLKQPGFGFSFENAFEGSNCADTDGGLATQMARYAEAISAGRLGYDSSKAYLCREQGRAYRDGGASIDFTPCESSFYPKVALGAACKASYECLNGTYCKPVNASTCEGVCAAPVTGGEICIPSRDVCEAGFDCQSDGTDFRCTELADADEECQSDSDCKPGLGCFEVEDVNAGSTVLCKTLAAVNDACFIDAAGNNNCASGACVTDETDGGTGATSGICLEPVGLGQDCGDGKDGKPTCDSCTLCGTSGKCENFGRTDNECSSDADCFDPQVWTCVDNTCQIRPRQGEACVSQDDGAQGTCMYWDNFCKKAPAPATSNSGTCTALPKLGESCGFERETTSFCREGFCDAQTNTCAPFSGEGQPCTTAEAPNGKSPVCTGDLFCDVRVSTGGDGVDGTCRVRLAEGEKCIDPKSCQAGTVCDLSSSNCVALSAEGDACQASKDCLAGMYCSFDADAGSVCAKKAAVGADCELNAECESNSCDPQLKQCVAECGAIESNTAGGCMNYDLQSLSVYLFFASILVPVLGRRRK